jgi:hypothetical protein
MKMEESKQLRKEAEEEGLLAEEDSNEPKFVLDLNFGPIFVKKDKIWELILMARRLSARASYGEHHAMLNLTLDKKFIHEQTVCCSRKYSASDKDYTVETYLKEQKIFDEDALL